MKKRFIAVLVVMFMLLPLIPVISMPVMATAYNESIRVLDATSAL